VIFLRGIRKKQKILKTLIDVTSNNQNFFTAEELSARTGYEITSYEVPRNLFWWGEGAIITKKTENGKITLYRVGPRAVEIYNNFLKKEPKDGQQ